MARTNTKAAAAAAPKNTTFADRAKARGLKVTPQEDSPANGLTFADRAKQSGANKAVGPDEDADKKAAADA